MARSTVHYADSETNNILKKLHNKLRPAGTPVQRVEYIIELLMLRVFEVKVQLDPEFTQLRELFRPDPSAADETARERDKLLFSSLLALPNDSILPQLNQRTFPFYSRILSEARKVWKGNLSTKVQDQLVLIEEIFGNSNFTNNVTSGNMAEIIGLVADLDKDRLLKTDLLGDAIESALSETGGTKDIGLHRTPDHIRQFMVAMIAPHFNDLLFDPTVGTGGFMFDCFEYVLQGVSRDGHWPGPKAHPELVAWFQTWFEQHPVEMPTLEVSTDFYRNGVGGIEYLGMVRKMAAINFYVRGLNPGNIQQGDALQKFGTDLLPESKTGIAANPPFGAERDQASYPNVWKEHAAESETTILFVKLMIETLKQHGRCAVIVSEGFLTWDQNSARALRRALLDECNLQAVISLPQGLFVHKGGQGPKTSILFFVKGEQTRDVWFYKVTNDGYTMGTNRKPIAGCQLVEALDIFHRYVREGQPPPETRNSFSIPAEWIKTLDPRVKDRIRTETRAEMMAKEQEDRTKLAKKLATQVASKKLTTVERDAKLAEHAEVWLSKTANAIAQKIERAHMYSFNLPNYRSSLTAEQVSAWQDFAATRVHKDASSGTLEKKYRALHAASPDDIDPLLSTLDPRHTLELDLARQFLTGLTPKVLADHPHLQTLQEIIATQAKSPRVKLKELIRLNTDRVYPSDSPNERFRVLGVNNETGVFLNGTLLGSEIQQANYRVKPGEFCYNPYRINVGSIGLNEFDYDNQIISGAYVIFGTDQRELHPKYLDALLKSPQFLTYVNERASGGVRMNFRFEHLEDWEIPLVPLEEQQKIAEVIDRTRRFTNGITQVLENWQMTLPDDTDYPLTELSEIITDSGYGSSDKADYGDRGYRMLRIGNIGFCSFNLSDIKRVKLVKKDYQKYRLEQGDFLIVRSNGNPALVGKCAVWDRDEDFVFASYLIRFRFNKKRSDPRYVMYYLMSPQGRALLNPQAGGGTYNISASVFQTVKIPLPPLPEQQRIVVALDAKMALLAELRGMREEADRAIQETLNRIWSD